MSHIYVSSLMCAMKQSIRPVCRATYMNKALHPGHRKVVIRSFPTTYSASCMSSSSRVVSSQVVSPSVTTADSSAVTRQTPLSAKHESIGTWIGIYKELSKPTLSSLVVGSTSAGYLMAGGPINATALAAVCVGTTLQAWSANTFNQVWEVKNDALMKRTARRPMPTGRISAAHALTWGCSSGIVGTGILLAGCNPLTASIGALNIALYTLIYTPMKTRSRWNTWAGSIVGALPPVMGWTAAGGSLLSPEPMLIGTTLFLWQFPHFFSLAWRSRLDYKAGGYKMVPVMDKSGQWTSSLIERYIMYIAPLPLLSSYFGLTSGMFAIESVVFNGYWLWMARKFSKKRTNKHAQQVFRASLWYLPVLLTLMVYHSRNWDETNNSKSKSQMTNLMDNDINSAFDLSTKGARIRGDKLGLWAEEKLGEIRSQVSSLCPHEWIVNTPENNIENTKDVNKPVIMNDCVENSSGLPLADDDTPLTSTPSSLLISLCPSVFSKTMNSLDETVTVVEKKK